jgi:predicted RNase H-like nuclease (RuvC/YqgF family)
VLQEGHEERFMNRLESALPKNKNPFHIGLRIAATIVVLLSIGLGYKVLNWDTNIETTVTDSNSVDEKQTEFSLSNLSPDLKKVENYYVGNINMELSKLEVSAETKDLVDSFMEQLNNLNEEYKALNQELNELGPNDQTITALIENLQLRLQLLQKLKRKLNYLKSSKNEQIKENSI